MQAADRNAASPARCTCPAGSYDYPNAVHESYCPLASEKLTLSDAAAELGRLKREGVNFAATRPRRWHMRHRRVWFGGSLTGFTAGLRVGDGALHFGVKVFHDRSRHYGNERHGEYGIAVWCRRSRKGDRGYPHTLTLKVLVA